MNTELKRNNEELSLEELSAIAGGNGGKIAGKGKGSTEGGMGFIGGGKGQSGTTNGLIGGGKKGG